MEKGNFYNDRSNRVRDLFWGIGGSLTYIILLFVILINVSILWNWNWLFITLYLLSLCFFVIKKRYYISIGMAITILLPLFIVGSCLIAIR